MYTSIQNVEAQKLISEIIRLQKELHVAIRNKETSDELLKNKPDNLQGETLALENKRNDQLNLQCERLKLEIGKILCYLRFTQRTISRIFF